MNHLYLRGLDRRITLSIFLILGMTLGIVNSSSILANETVLIDSEEKASIVFNEDDACDDVTDGGIIMAKDTFGCEPGFDPDTIINVVLPSGGSGALEYLWMRTVHVPAGGPGTGAPNWIIVPNSNTPYYDPGFLSETTWFIRCVRREGCSSFSVESNIVIIEIGPCIPCDNVTDGGRIEEDQSFCGDSYDPDSIFNVTLPMGGTGVLEYAWYKTTTDNPYTPGSPSWTRISNADKRYYNPPPVIQTTYFVRVARRQHCDDYVGISNRVKIELFPVPEVIADIESELLCFGSSEGSITTFVTGGTPPYSYDWDNGAPDVANPNGLTAGTYNLLVTDANGCTDEATVTLNEPDSIDIDINKVGPLCVGDANGTATAAVSGGTPPYTYLWNTGDTDSSIIDLEAGAYQVTVTDDNGCQKTAIVIIEDPEELTVEVEGEDPSCFSFTNGSAEAIVNGGTPPYTYAWNTGEATAQIFGLSAGDYSITVTDANECEAIANLSLEEPDLLALDIEKTDLLCFGDNSGTAQVFAQGGTMPYTYNWSNGGSTALISGLAAGTYSVTVTDANNCESIISVVLVQPNELEIAAGGQGPSCNGGSNGNAEVVATGGTPPYSYSWSNGETTSFISGLSAGSYSVTVTDANNCEATTLVNIDEPEEIEVSITKTDALCNGDETGTASASASGGTPPYTYLWSNGANTANINGLNAGTYSVTVTDANSCVGSGTVVIEEPQLLEVDLNATAVTCNGSNDGTAMAIPTGGTPPFSYTWSNGETTQSISGLTAGNYSVTVTDANGCEAEAEVKVLEPDEIEVAVSGTAVNCFDGDDGTANASATGGTQPYAYLWSTGATTASIVGLSAGTYSVTVTDENGCEGVGEVTINEPPQLELQVISTDASCDGGMDGTAGVSAVGGTPPYIYEWNTGANTATITGLSAGIYSVTVTDANDCEATASVEVESPSDIELDVIGTDVLCKDDEDGTAAANASGGTQPYIYSWSTGASTTTITGLAAGTYSVTVTDDNGCTALGSVEIEEPPLLEVDVNATAVTCNGGNDGTAMAIPSGGTPPYNYTWSNGGTTQVIIGLTAGNYSVTVTDANDCEAEGEVKVLEPDEIEVSVSGTPVSCFDGDDGTATVSVSGGIQPYTYLWNTGATSASISGLSAGTYGVTVTDENGCTGTGEVTITEPPQLNLDITSTDASCDGGNDGTASVIASGGTPPYTYEWNTGATTATITGLSAGIYSVTVTDANDCEATASVEVESPVDIELTVTGTDVLCKDDENGTATASTSGGTPPYTYSWNTGASTATITGLGAGTYSVTVVDDNGCSAAGSVEINEPELLEVEVTATATSCNGAEDGTAMAVPFGGTPPYTYEWSNGGTTQIITGLAAGNYSVTVTDANGCEANGEIKVLEPDEIEVSVTGSPVSCFDGNDGTAVAVASGGSSPYAYIWSNGDAGPTISGLTAGTYSVTVTDDNGCTGTGSVTIDEPSEIELTLSSNDPSCEGESDGSASASASGGTSPYDYIWSNGANTASINGLSAGTYTVTVTDDNNCEAVGSVTLTDPDGIDLNVNVTNQPDCFGDETGAVEAIVSGGTSPYSYLWNNGSTSASVSGLPAGTYTVTVTDVNGCDATESVVIEQPPVLSCEAEIVEQVSGDGANDGVATVVVSGGTPPYTYLWDNGNTNQTADDLSEGEHFVTVTDANGCTCVSSIIFCDNVTNGGIVSGNETGCGPDFDPAPITNVLEPMGGSGELEYLWMMSLVGPPFSMNDPFWVAIPGATDESYDPGPIQYTTYFIRCVRREGCEDYIGESNIVVKTVALCDDECDDNIYTAGTIKGNETSCGGFDPGIIESTGLPDGGNGPVEYSWMKTTGNPMIGPVIWENIPNSNAEDLDPDPISETTWYKRSARTEGCDEYGNSNLIVKHVKDLPIAEIENPPIEACLGEFYTFSAVDAGPDANYVWNFGTASLPSAGFEQTIEDVSWSTPGVKTVTLNVALNNCITTDVVNINVSDDQVDCPNLDMEIIDLTGQVIDTNKVALNWTVRTGLDYLYFVIERSTDGTSFRSIGTLNEISSGDDYQSFDYLDETPVLGKNFYRIKQISVFGHVVYSDVIEIQMNGVFEENKMVIYPNPTIDNKIFISFIRPLDSSGTIELVNNMGVVMWTRDVQFDQYRVEVDLGDVPAGVYYVKIRAKNAPFVIEQVYKLTD